MCSAQIFLAQLSLSTRLWPMKEQTIQNVLYDWLLRKGTKLVCPNYTPESWWECDLWAMTEAGFSTEFEIKLTRADFRKDAAKIEKLNWKERRAGKTPELKHAKLQLADARGPSRFFYVTPKDLLKPEDIPEWAGHIEIVAHRGRLKPGVTKPAPVLHRERVPQKIIDHCKSVFYYRYWSLRQKTFPVTGSSLLPECNT